MCHVAPARGSPEHIFAVEQVNYHYYETDGSKRMRYDAGGVPDGFAWPEWQPRGMITMAEAFGVSTDASMPTVYKTMGLHTPCMKPELAVRLQAMATPANSRAAWDEERQKRMLQVCNGWMSATNSAMMAVSSGIISRA